MLRSRKKTPQSGRDERHGWADVGSKRNTEDLDSRGGATFSSFLEENVPFLALLIVRILSAMYNIIHDCDEVYNYWEPLHFLLYGYGRQTWEYSSRFSLRSYLYLLIHWVVAYPLKMVFKSGVNKYFVFLGVRIAMAIICAKLESGLYMATRKWCRPLAFIFACLLVGNSGMFFASTTFLPSTFAMYAMISASTGVLNGNNTQIIVSATLGVVLGWPVAGVAFLAHAIYIILAPQLMKSIAILIGSLVVTIIPLAAADFYFYGKPTISQWNFIKYNVFGGGQSDLYGIEPWTFYFRNALLNFNVVLLLAGVLWLGLWTVRPPSKIGKKRAPRLGRITVVCLSVVIWFGAISILPHKEERFLYVVYPQICLSAALSWYIISSQISRLSPFLSKLLTFAIITLYTCVSTMRILAILNHYGAPVEVYRNLPALDPLDRSTLGGTGGTVSVDGHVNVCVGDEWYRFPSAFMFPSERYRLQFVKQGFTGMLPGEFNPAAGGTQASPPELNDQNIEAPALYIANITHCDFLIDYELAGRPSLRSKHAQLQWDTVFQKPFLENSMSPMLYRALYIPGKSEEKNVWGSYVLLRQVVDEDQESE